MKLLRTASVIAVFAMSSALPGVASAQTLPTAPQVGDSLDIGCATTINGVLIDEIACVAAITAAVDVATRYFAVGGDGTVPPQLDIGYYLCQLGIRVPSVVDEIAAQIGLANNINLRTGCQDAIDAVTPPTPKTTSKA